MIAALSLAQQSPSAAQPVPAGSTSPALTPTPSRPTSPAATSPPSPTPAQSVPPAGITARVDAAWADAVAADLGIPARVFRAYAGAASAVLDEFGECGLGWNTLAGIGWVESHHGTIAGGTVTADGQAEPPIVGIALDGSRSARIQDTDDGTLDGDRTWDRAVGPMQFIPSTWATWGTDGNGDGLADPQHIDDAALSAARYLCAVGGDLTQPQNWIAAVAAYNNSISYNNQVADAADRYARSAQHR